MVVDLDARRLRVLALMIYSDEVMAMRRNQVSRGENEAANWTDCTEAAGTTVDLLDSFHRLRDEFQGNNEKSPIAHEICSYVERGVNYALQGLRNNKIRKSYITKLRHHADEMTMRLRTFDSADVAAAEQLAESATAFKNFMFEQHEIMRSPLSQAYSTVLHQDGKTFQELVQRCHGQTFWDLRGAPFESLTENQKIKVYARIIEESGQASPLENLISKVGGPAGTAFLLFTAGIIAWGIFSSHGMVDGALTNLIQTGARAGGGGALLGEALGVPVAEPPTDSTLCAVMAGIVTGVGDDVIIGMFTSSFVERFITNGGYSPITTTNYRYYVIRTLDDADLEEEIRDGTFVSRFLTPGDALAARFLNLPSWLPAVAALLSEPELAALIEDMLFGAAGPARAVSSSSSRAKAATSSRAKAATSSSLLELALDRTRRVISVAFLAARAAGSSSSRAVRAVALTASFRCVRAAALAALLELEPAEALDEPNVLLGLLKLEPDGLAVLLKLKPTTLAVLLELKLVDLKNYLRLLDLYF